MFPQGADKNPYPTQMVLMLGDGEGAFNVGSYLKNYDFYQTVVGDFNGDGKLDLITRGKTHFSLFLGNGDGTFHHSRDYPYVDLAAQMVAGDFNNDGKLDLLLYEAPIFGTNMGFAVNVLLGNGDGTFKAPLAVASFPTAAGCNASGVQGDLLLSDFNADGKLDLAFCNQTQIGVMMGNGDGTFQQAVFYNAGTHQQFAFAIGDVNSDGKLDLLVSRYDNVNDTQFEIFLGNGDGTFQSPQTSHQVSAYFGFVLGDFNSDGVLDFLAPSGGGMQAYIQ